MTLQPWSEAEEVLIAVCIKARCEMEDVQAALRDLAKIERSPTDIAAKMREMRERAAA